jgi:hypothetical protein
VYLDTTACCLVLEPKKKSTRCVPYDVFCVTTAECLDNSLDYHWEELWKSLVSLLDFITTKLGKPSEGGRVEQLVQEVSSKVSKLDMFLPDLITDNRPLGFVFAERRLIPRLSASTAPVCCKCISLTY